MLLMPKVVQKQLLYQYIIIIITVILQPYGPLKLKMQTITELTVHFTVDLFFMTMLVGGEAVLLTQLVLVV